MKFAVYNRLVFIVEVKRESELLVNMMKSRVAQSCLQACCIAQKLKGHVFRYLGRFIPVTLLLDMLEDERVKKSICKV